MGSISELSTEYEVGREVLVELDDPLMVAEKEGELGAIAEQLGVKHTPLSVEPTENWFAQAAYHFTREVQLLRQHLDGADSALLADPIRCQRAIFAAMRSRNSQVKKHVVGRVEDVPYSYEKGFGQQAEIYHMKALASILDQKPVQAVMTLDAYEDEFEMLADSTHHPKPPRPIFLPILRGFANEDGAQVSLGLEQGFQRVSDTHKNRQEDLIHRLSALYTQAIDSGLKVRVMAPALQYVRNNLKDPVKTAPSQS